MEDLEVGDVVYNHGYRGTVREYNFSEGLYEVQYDAYIPSMTFLEDPEDLELES